MVKSKGRVAARLSQQRSPHSNNHTSRAPCSRALAAAAAAEWGSVGVSLEGLLLLVEQEVTVPVHHWGCLSAEVLCLRRRCPSAVANPRLNTLWGWLLPGRQTLLGGPCSQASFKSGTSTPLPLPLFLLPPWLRQQPPLQLLRLVWSPLHALHPR